MRLTITIGRNTPAPLAHDDIRAIVREELTRLLRVDACRHPLECEREPSLRITDHHHSDTLDRLQVKGDDTLLHLGRLALVVDELQRDRRMHPQEVSEHVSVAISADEAHREALSGRERDRYECMNFRKHVRSQSDALPVVDKCRHETSPSADDVGAHSVGDRAAVGAHMKPPQPSTATALDGDQ